jgi:protein-S-isoprenylcysteine O-methyltransferase Ste14
MASLILGAMAYACAACFDLAALAGRKNLKRLAGLLALVSFSIAFVWAILVGPALAVPGFLSVLGWPLMAIAIALLLYSLFLEIPFTNTYLAHDAPSKLVRTGTYALCRHPGVLWLGFFLLGAVLASRSYTLLWAALLWWGLDFIYAWWQDRWLFPRQFPDYRAYQRETPMFLPTRASIRHCLRTLGRRLPET